MLLGLLRGVFAISMLCTALYALSLGMGEYRNLLGGLVSAVLILIVASAVLYADWRDKEKRIATVSAVFFGLLLGLIIGWLIGQGADALVLSAFPAYTGDDPRAIKLAEKVSAIVRIAISLTTCYYTISMLVQTRDDFRFIIPYVEFSKQVKGGRPLVLDTSVIIDGRIADVCETRLIDTKILVPKFILQELQGIADSSDKLKRNRGRRGLDILKKLQGNTKIDLEMHDGNAGELKPGEKMRVDERLVAFTKIVGGRVVTNDYNLNKIAQLQGVEVINLNEVSNALKTLALPGDFLTLKLVKAGEQAGQAIGYLDDGTMVVVEQGRNAIGQEVSIIVTSVLQTNAGRMIFGRQEQRQSGSFVPVGMSGSHTPVSIDQAPQSGSSATHKPVEPPEPPKN